MSDDFIPLNQSTPVGGRWQARNNQRHQGRFNRPPHSGQRRGGYNNRWGNQSQRNSSYGSDSNNSFADKNNIDAYLHPSMLEDPWAKLKAKLNDNNMT